jgi:hypothetical protein
MSWWVLSDGWGYRELPYLHAHLVDRDYGFFTIFDNQVPSRKVSTQNTRIYYALPLTSKLPLSCGQLLLPDKI